MWPWRCQPGFSGTLLVLLWLLSCSKWETNQTLLASSPITSLAFPTRSSTLLSTQHPSTGHSARQWSPRLCLIHFCICRVQLKLWLYIWRNQACHRRLGGLWREGEYMESLGYNSAHSHSHSFIHLLPSPHPYNIVSTICLALGMFLWNKAGTSSPHRPQERMEVVTGPSGGGWWGSPSRSCRSRAEGHLTWTWMLGKDSWKVRSPSDLKDEVGGKEVRGRW